MAFWLNHINLYRMLIKVGVRNKPDRESAARMAELIAKNPELTINGMRMRFDPLSAQDRLIYDTVFNGSGYEPGVTKLLSKLIGKGMTFVDIGSNSGYYTLLAASRLRGSGRIIAIEPQRRVYERLKANVRLNRIRNAKMLNNAAYSRSTMVEIGIPQWGDAESSIDYPNAKGHERIRAITLDSVCKRPDVIKIDVEGYELEVFQGMHEGLKHVKHIVFEQNMRRLLERGMDPDSVINYIKKQGFKMHDADSGRKIDTYRDASAIASNIHAERG